MRSYSSVDTSGQSMGDFFGDSVNVPHASAGEPPRAFPLPTFAMMQGDFLRYY